MSCLEQKDDERDKVPEQQSPEPCDSEKKSPAGKGTDFWRIQSIVTKQHATTNPNCRPRSLQNFR